MVVNENPENNANIPASNPRAREKRRILISESLATDIPLSLHGVSPLPELEPVKPPQEIEDRKGEIRRILKRLLAIIEEHRLIALRMSILLDAAAIQQVLLALEAETRREDPQPHLITGDEVRDYVLTSLYEELLAEPSNILFTTHIARDVVRYEAMEVAFWKKCVAALRLKLTKTP
jgi:hypothetical protein